jgi:hypothetical protein
LAKKQRRNWRENGLRPRGRGYDWARTLVAEELLKRAAGAEVLETTIGELAGLVKCSDRIVRLEIARLCAINGFGARASAQDACVVKLPRRPGPGSGVRLAVNRIELARRVLGRLKRNQVRSHRDRRQLELPIEEKVQIPSEIQQAVDRIQSLAAARRASEWQGEDLAKRAAAPAKLLPRRIPDPFPHTPQTQNITPSERGSRADFRMASPAGVDIPRRVPGLTVRPDRDWLRKDWLEIQGIDRTEHETLSEKHRRRLMRHLRLACWSKGLDRARTRHVVGAVGWEAQRMRKASTRKYLIIDAITWLLASSPAQLRGATNHFLGMVKVVRGLGAGADVRP